MYFVNGAVIISKDVTVESLSHSSLSIQVNGAIYCPTHLSGVATGLVTGEMVTYENDLPRFEAGDFSLTNAFLQSLDQPQQFVILGVLRFPEDLNMELFMEKITKLEVKGVVSLHEQQESFFHKKVSSLLGCVMEVIPAGYQTLKKTLRLNGRSIRRFKCAKLYTKKPIILDHSITREAFSEAIDKIHTKSIIICPEHLEDLIYETCNVLDTEVIPFVESFLFIEGEEHWSEEQISALDKPINLIVKGLVTFSDDVTTETLKERIAEINLFGEIRATNKKILGALQSLLVINHGEIKETGEKEQVTYLDNIGELSL
ncbi:hypothetical protein [Halalkalibacter akibai]|uniref:Uncharacterized protein n=1 Tax=Halalkalibacter akibai (strain ATCC 43226 / DSM 21942 / CIP 109018 / JCM 9157 / 1139) TaxID=1236973 RepID=W4QV42_HALA3|nr:hypothetical protein [Halalkalibacter akibai]GAE35478.1 hypothetical protein JCM9157_2588 [Halalkalibacter akibai JCM 9157]